MLSTFTNHFTALSSAPNRAIALSTDKSHIMIACESFMFFLCVSPWGGLWIIPVFGIRWQLCSYLPFMCKYNTPEREREAVIQLLFPPRQQHTKGDVHFNHYNWKSRDLGITCHHGNARDITSLLGSSVDSITWHAGIQLRCMPSS